MAEISDRVIERVRKMLALANDKGATEGERDNALRMAHATLAKYNLDLAFIDSQAPNGKKPGLEARVKHLATFYGRPWARIVADSVGDLMFCKYLYIAQTKAKDTIHLFIGSHANAVSAAILSEYLVTSIIREGRVRQRANGEANAWFRSFGIGAAGAISRRCTALRAAAVGAPGADIRSPPLPDSPPGTGIVLRSLYDREAAANAAYVSANVAVCSSAPKHDVLRGTLLDPMLEGAAYGNTVSLNRQVK